MHGVRLNVWLIHGVADRGVYRSIPTPAVTLAQRDCRRVASRRAIEWTLRVVYVLDSRFARMTAEKGNRALHTEKRPPKWPFKTQNLRSNPEEEERKS